MIEQSAPRGSSNGGYALAKPPADFEWLAPWRAIPEGDTGLADELRSEVPRDHVLYGRTVIAVARRDDCDDVCFATDDTAMPIVVVHLTWHGLEIDGLPWTEGFASWQEFTERRMVPDHDEIEQSGDHVHVAAGAAALRDQP